jgi:ferrous-iron efflux pump FieF
MELTPLTAISPVDGRYRGKLEPLAALGQAAFIAGSAVFLVISAGQRFIAPRPVQQEEVGIAVMLASIAATTVLVIYQKSVVRRTGSLAISSDRLHYLGDILVNAAVIVALVLWRELGWTWIDPLFAIAIAGYILFTAWRIAEGALDMLMDRELPDAERQRTRCERTLLHERPARTVHDLIDPSVRFLLCHRYFPR